MYMYISILPNVHMYMVVVGPTNKLSIPTILWYGHSCMESQGIHVGVRVVTDPAQTLPYHHSVP